MSIHQNIPFMKHFLLSNALCLVTLIAGAQFNVGQKLLGGNIGFSLSKTEPMNNAVSSASTNFSVSPSFGTFKKPNLLNGFELSYSYSSQKSTIANNQTSKTHNQSFAANVFSQRFFTLAPRFFFTVHTSVFAGYNFGKQKTITGNTETSSKTNGFSLGAALAPGLSYKLTERLLFDAYLSNLVNIAYSHSESKDVNEIKQDNLILSSGLSNTSLGNVGLGFRWLLK